MNELTQLILFSLKKFKVALALEVDNKIVLLNPRILEGVTLDTLADSLSASDLTDEEIIKALQIVDNARKPPQIGNIKKQK